MKSKGHGRYYYTPEWNQRIIFGYKPGDALNRERLQADVADFYSKSQKTKFEVLQKIRLAA